VILKFFFTDYEITGGVGLSILGCCEGVRAWELRYMGRVCWLKVVEMRRQGGMGAGSHVKRRWKPLDARFERGEAEVLSGALHRKLQRNIG